ncbi:MAG: hypothetical protein ABI467_06085 [Kofleriaceae bacterium]
MRSICAVIVACLVAVAGVRPIDAAQLERAQRDRSATFAPADAALAVLARRDRGHGQGADVQLPIATLPVVAGLAPLRLTIELELEAPRSFAVTAPPTPRSSRGPPNA